MARAEGDGAFGTIRRLCARRSCRSGRSLRSVLGLAAACLASGGLLARAISLLARRHSGHAPKVYAGSVSQPAARAHGACGRTRRASGRALTRVPRLPLPQGQQLRQ